MRWNLSSRGRELSGGDALVLSIPKSGRTWLRTFVSAYFAEKAGRPFGLTITDGGTAGVPRLIYSHDLFEHRTKGSWWDRRRGKYLVPPKQTLQPILLLARDPRDAFVSYFIQWTRRNPSNAFKNKKIDNLVGHSRFGVAAMVDVLNRWWREFHLKKNFALVRYEDLLADPECEFRRVLLALGEIDISAEAFSHALEFSSFENMQRLEASETSSNKILLPGDRSDPESFKVRRGKKGGFSDYLSLAGQEEATAACARLLPVFRYSE